MDEELIVGRECGACRACCVELAINDPALQKQTGTACHHLSATGGCGIYDGRPHTCRTFYCGWRRWSWVGAEMRPDTSRVLIMQVKNPDRTDASHEFAVAFVFIDRGALEAKGVPEAIAATVKAGIGAHLLVPGRPGDVFRRQRLNERLGDAVRQGDKPSLLRALHGAYRHARLKRSERLVLRPLASGQVLAPDERTAVASQDDMGG